MNICFCECSCLGVSLTWWHWGVRWGWSHLKTHLADLFRAALTLSGSYWWEHVHMSSPSMVAGFPEGASSQECACWQPRQKPQSHVCHVLMVRTKLRFQGTGIVGKAGPHQARSWAMGDTAEVITKCSLLPVTCMHQCSVTSVVSDSLQPCGLWPARLFCPWDSPGKNTGVGCHVFFQGIFPTQKSNPFILRLLHWQAESLPLIAQGSPPVSYL